VQPLVSIIMPCYNAGRFIEASLQSVLDQTYTNFELIIINDGSTDDSENKILLFNDSRIRYFYQDNAGQAAASNAGLVKSSGDYIKFFDADDIMNDIHIEAQVKSLEKTTDTISACDWGRFYSNDTNETIFDNWNGWLKDKPINWLRKEIDQKDYMRGDMIGAWRWLIPKNIIGKSGGWDERLSLNNDFEFSIRLLLSAKELVFTKDAKMYYRSGNTGSLNSSVSEKAYQAAFLSTKLGCDRLLQEDPGDTMKRICANRYQLWVTRMFPAYPELVKQFEAEIDKLGGADPMIGGGKSFNMLIKILGWKNAVLLKRKIAKLKG